jgi:hypothetical protein
MMLRKDLVIEAGPGWALGKPRSVGVLGTSLIFVLDSDWKRVSVHSSADGALIRTIGNGYGTGRGQFALPVDMALVDSTLHVLDFELRRLSTFSVRGAHVRDLQIRSSEARSLAYRGQEPWVKLMNTDSGAALARVGNDGALRYEAGSLNSADKDLFTEGRTGSVSSSLRDGKVVYLNGDASRVSLHPAGVQIALRTSAAFWKSAETAATRATGGIAAMPNGRIAALISLRSATITTSDRRPLVTHHIVVFDAAGNPIAREDVSSTGMPLSIDAGARDDELYVAFTGARAKVVRYRMLSAATGDRAKG